MCAQCVAQASVYVGASIGALRVMGHRAKLGRTSPRSTSAQVPEDADREDVDQDGAEAAPAG